MHTRCRHFVASSLERNVFCGLSPGSYMLPATVVSELNPSTWFDPAGIADRSPGSRSAPRDHQGPPTHDPEGCRIPRLQTQFPCTLAVATSWLRLLSATFSAGLRRAATCCRHFVTPMAVATSWLRRLSAMSSAGLRRAATCCRHFVTLMAVATSWMINFWLPVFCGLTPAYAAQLHAAVNRAFGIESVHVV